MTSKWLIIPLLIMTSACAHFIPIKTEYKVVKPDPILLQCDSVTALPSPDTLTDAQVATLINQMWTDGKICKNNMDSLKDFYAKTDQIFNDKDAKGKK